jgi:hypothetical protein
MNWKKLGMVFALGLVVSFYTTFVLENLWNWFAVSALGAPQISYWTAYGFVLLIRLLFDKDTTYKEQEIFGRLGMMIDACVPEEKRAELTEQLLEEDKGLVGRLFGGVFGEALGVTLTLGLGWAVHTFLT